MDRTFRRRSLTIANGATTSDAFNGDQFAAFGLVMPAAFTGTAITFTVSGDDSTYTALYDRYNTQVSVTVAVSRAYDLPIELAAWKSFKIVSGSAEGGARTLVVVGKT